MRKTLAAIASVLSMGVLTVAPALADVSGPGAEKLELAGPRAEVWCADVTPTPWEDATELRPGFVIFNQDLDEDVVKATISVKGWDPDATYAVRLIQGVGDCYTVDGTLSTNGQGNGTLHLEEPAVGVAAQVIIDTTSIFGLPTYRATDRYLLQ